MLPCDFKERNLILGKPISMMDDECLSLPVFRGQTTDGLPCVISCWKFNKEDLEEISKTGCIWLNVVGGNMPPVSLFTEHPFNI